MFWCSALNGTGCRRLNCIFTSNSVASKSPTLPVQNLTKEHIWYRCGNHWFIFCTTSTINLTFTFMLKISDPDMKGKLLSIRWQIHILIPISCGTPRTRKRSCSTIKSLLKSALFVPKSSRKGWKVSNIWWKLGHASSMQNGSKQRIFGFSFTRAPCKRCMGDDSTTTQRARWQWGAAALHTVYYG